MTGKIRRTFTPEFKLEAAQLLAEQNYSIREATSAMNVGKSTMDKWVKQLKMNLKGLKITRLLSQQINVK